MRIIILFTLLLASPLRAEPPRVVTTVAPLYGILSDLMRGVAEPTPMVTKGTDPHYFSLKPSQIFALNDAELLFVVGANMEPWLPRVLPGLQAQLFYMGDIPELSAHQLPLRALKDIGDAPNIDPSAPSDPHMWLDPVVARIWIRQTTLILSTADPDNSEIYARNAEQAILALDTAVLQLQNVANAAQNLNFVTSHDSLQYLENRFDLNIVGSLSNALGEQAGARSLSRLSSIEGNTCLLTDTSEAVADYADLFPNWPKSEFDPLGYDLAGEPDYLANLYLSLAAALESCITDP